MSENAISQFRVRCLKPLSHPSGLLIQRTYVPQQKTLRPNSIRRQVIVKRLKTYKISVAKLRLSDLEKQERPMEEKLVFATYLAVRGCLRADVPLEKTCFWSARAPSSSVRLSSSSSISASLSKQ